MPWEFSDDQKEKLNQLLQSAPKGRIEIDYIISDGARVSGMARYIEGVFRAKGFIMAPEIGMLSSPANPRGMQVTYTKEDDFDRANIYAAIFSELGVPCNITKRDLSRNPQDPRFLDPVTIRIFCKP